MHRNHDHRNHDVARTTERDPDEGDDLAPSTIVERVCLRCLEVFPSQHRFNRMCRGCARTASNNEITPHGVALSRIAKG